MHLLFNSSKESYRTSVSFKSLNTVPLDFLNLELSNIGSTKFLTILAANSGVTDSIVSFGFDDLICE